MTLKRVRNGELVDLTPEEEAAVLAERAAAEAAPRAVPRIVPKLAFVRAARRLTLAGGIVSLGSACAWDTIKPAIAANAIIAENFDLANDMVRSDPDFAALATALSVQGAAIDAVFRLADAIDRGVVAPGASNADIAAVLT